MIGTARILSTVSVAMFDGCLITTCLWTGEDIKWNFGKFLISNGNSIKRCLLLVMLVFLYLGVPAGSKRVRGRYEVGKCARLKAHVCYALVCIGVSLGMLLVFVAVVVHESMPSDRYEPTTSPKAILPDIESAVNRARIM
jgi:hypothetical protein